MPSTIAEAVVTHADESHATKAEFVEFRAEMKTAFAKLGKTAFAELRLTHAILAMLLWGGAVGGSVVLPPAVAQEAAAGFVVEDIRIEGLRRFSPGTIFSRLPITIGDTFSAAQSAQIIADLYETGFFRSIELERDGNILVVVISENPTITEVTVSGASDLPDDALNALLAEANVAKAKIFNQSVVDEVVRVIEEAYIERNFFDVEVEVVSSPLPRNRVALLINVEEGDRAAIREIRLIGNEVFSNFTLDNDIRLEERGILNFFTDSYYYTEAALEADVNRIRTRYLEEGYLRVEIESQTEVSPDKRHIDIVIRIAEGPQFTVEAIEVRFADNVSDPPFELAPLQPFITQEVGEIYSGRLLGGAAADMKKAIADIGYANGDVRFEPDINDETGLVKVVYVVFPENVVFIRRINIVGNFITSDEVIRRELLQFEKERYSEKKIAHSRSRIRRLGYFDRVDITTLPVPDEPDLVDINIEVSELNTGEIRLGAGYNGDTGVSFNAGFSNDNIFGSGNDFSVDASIGDDDKRFDFSLDERYYTTEGVTRHIGGSYGETDSGADTSAYSIDGYKGEYGFEFPFANDGRYNIYLVYQRVNINEVQNNFAYTEFVDEYGLNLDIALLEYGLTYDTRDSALLASEGQRIVVAGDAAIPAIDLDYYRINYTHDVYQTWDFIPTDPTFHARFGYGFGDTYSDGVFPFYHRYYLGGTQNLRGFKANSIGYTLDGSNDAIGGKSRMYLNLEWSTRVEFFEDQRIYLVPFFDVGAVGKDLGLGSFRASSGVELRWQSPIGPLRFSYVKDVKSHATDDTEAFQFTVSTF